MNIKNVSFKGYINTGGTVFTLTDDDGLNKVSILSTKLNNSSGSADFDNFKNILKKYPNVAGHEFLSVAIIENESKCVNSNNFYLNGEFLDINDNNLDIIEKVTKFSDRVKKDIKKFYMLEGGFLDDPKLIFAHLGFNFDKNIDCFKALNTKEYKNYVYNPKTVATAVTNVSEFFTKKMIKYFA